MMIGNHLVRDVILRTQNLSMTAVKKTLPPIVDQGGGRPVPTIAVRWTMMKFLLAIPIILSSSCTTVDARNGTKSHTHGDSGVQIIVDTMQGDTIRPTSKLEDGREPPILIRGQTKTPTRILLAVHGFSDRAWGFDRLANGLLNGRNRDLLIVAYDQRSFGWTAQPDEVWPGSDQLVKDFIDVYNSIEHQYPDAEMYVLGHSMGGAVVVRAFTANNQYESIVGRPIKQPKGLILAAPALCSAANQGYVSASTFAILGHGLIMAHPNSY
jgi:pimeloyl-ACP methyl ester carboxylesterase